MTAITPQEFRLAMSAFATGVTVVTCRDRSDQPIGMTVNSFASVSLRPPLLLWCVNRAILPFAAFRAAGHFAIHVLRHDQQTVSDHFAFDRTGKFEGIEVHEGIGGSPLLADYLALYQCETTDRIEAGDHVILVGRLLACEVREGEPLVFQGGSYRRLAVLQDSDNTDVG
jgi:3-hydroxy-9,10-secoandrosta-1,3,5(10)-triene-9,17-dione monooxygenase reductase component